MFRNFSTGFDKRAPISAAAGGPQEAVDEAEDML